MEDVKWCNLMYSKQKWVNVIIIYIILEDDWSI